MEELRDTVEIADDEGLQDDAHVGSEEEFDVDCLGPAWVVLVDELDAGSETLQVDQDQEDYHCSQELTQVETVLASEGLAAGLEDGGLGHQEMHPGDDSSLELDSELGSHCNWAEGKPEDSL